MSDEGEGKKKKINFDSMTGPSAFGAFGGLFIIQGIISLCWGITKRSYEFNSLVADVITALSAQEIAQFQICLYGLVCVIGGALLFGVDRILETIKPSGRKPTLKGWLSSVLGAAFISGALFLPFFIIFSIIKH